MKFSMVIMPIFILYGICGEVYKEINISNRHEMWIKHEKGSRKTERKNNLSTNNIKLSTTVLYIRKKGIL